MYITAYSVMNDFIADKQYIVDSECSDLHIYLLGSLPIKGRW